MSVQIPISEVGDRLFCKLHHTELTPYDGENPPEGESEDR